jgi:hypothetical protein
VSNKTSKAIAEVNLCLIGSRGAFYYRSNGELDNKLMAYRTIEIAVRFQ